MIAIREPRTSDSKLAYRVTKKKNKQQKHRKPTTSEVLAQYANLKRCSKSAKKIH
jgi:hypothetical protein